MMVKLIQVATEESGGLPQFDPTTFESQITWLFLSFIVLYILISRVALPRVTSVIKEREESIADNLDNAERMRQEADAVKTSYETAVADARQKAQAVLMEAKADIQKEMSAASAKLDETLAAQAGEAETRIAAAKSEALDSLSDIAKDVAVDMVSKLSGADVKEATVSKAVTDALAEVKGA